MVLERRLGQPGDGALKRLLSQGHLLNCRLLPVDVDMARHLFGPNTYSFEANATAPAGTKSTSRKTEIVGNTLHADIFYLTSSIGKTVNLITIDEATGYIHVREMKDKTTKDCHRLQTIWPLSITLREVFSC